MAKGRQTVLTTRIVWILVLLFLAATIISQLFIHFYNPLITEAAELYTTSSYTELTGVYVRNESIVNYSGSGIVSYVYADGEKLAKNSEIARIYSSNNDLVLQRQIDKLNEQIKILQDAENLIGSDNSQLEAFSDQIYENQSQLFSTIESKNYSDIETLKNSYLNLASKKQIVKGTAADFGLKISALQSQINTLQSQISEIPQNLEIDRTGYFASTVDGYENQLNYDSIASLDEAKINEIISNPQINTDTTAIGKIIADYKWKLVCVIPAEDAHSFFEGATLTVRLGSELNTTQATVEKMTLNTETGNMVTVLSFDVLGSDLLGGRTIRFRILLDDYAGIRIPKSAVRFDENENAGVYVKLGVEILFKKIDVMVYEGDYAIVKNTSDKDGYLSLYDSVVTEGTDLYDGKIVMQ